MLGTIQVLNNTKFEILRIASWTISDQLAKCIEIQLRRYHGLPDFWPVERGDLHYRRNRKRSIPS